MPDSRAVVFRSDRYGSDDLLVQGLDDRNARELVVGAGDQGLAQRTPDGMFFLYWELGKNAGDPLRLLRIPVGGGPTELVLEARPPAFFACATTPDGPCQLVEVRVDEDVMTVSRLDPVEGKGQEVIPASRLLLRICAFK